MRVSKINNDMELLRSSKKYLLNGRDRISLHKNNNSALHHMLILLDQSSYVRPHRHRNKSESYLILKGVGVYFEFDDLGAVDFFTVLEPFGNSNGNPFVLYVENSKKWHTLLSLTENLYFSESTIGPFNVEDSEFAPWSLETTASKKDIHNFLKNLQKMV